MYPSTTSHAVGAGREFAGGEHRLDAARPRVVVAGNLDPPGAGDPEVSVKVAAAV